MSFAAASSELLPGSLAASFLGAAWALILPLLIGAALWPRRAAAPGSSSALGSLARLDAEDPGAALLSWWLLGAAMAGPVALVLSAASSFTARSLVVTDAALTVLAALIAGRRVARALAASLRALLRDVAGDGPAAWIALLATGAVLATTLLLATIPTTHFDDLVYHLGLPRQGLLIGHWPELPRFLHSLMAAGWEAAQALPLALGGGLGPQLMNAGVLALLAVTAARLARRAAPAWAAWSATAVLLASPVLMGLGSLAGNDLVVGLGLLVALDALVRARGSAPRDESEGEGQPGPAAALRAGLAAGMACAAKLTGLLGAAVLCAFVIAEGARSRSGRLRPVLLAAILMLAAVIVASPWLVRSALITGNPLHPAASGLMPSSTWDSDSARLLARDSAQGAWPASGARAPVIALTALARGADELGDPAGVTPGLVPALWLLGLLLAMGFIAPRGHDERAAPSGEDQRAARRDLARSVMTHAALAFLAWCATALMLRFFVAPLLATSALLAMGLDAAASRAPALPRALALAAALAAAGIGASSASRCLDRLGPDATWSEALAGRDVLVRRVEAAGANRDMAVRLPDDARLFVVGESRLGLMPRPAEIGTAIDAPLVGDLLDGCRSPEDVMARLQGRATHVLVSHGELARFDRQYELGRRLGTERVALLRAWLSGLEPVACWGDLCLYPVPGPG